MDAWIFTALIALANIAGNNRNRRGSKSRRPDRYDRYKWNRHICNQRDRRLYIGAVSIPIIRGYLIKGQVYNFNSKQYSASSAFIISSGKRHTPKFYFSHILMGKHHRPR